MKDIHRAMFLCAIVVLGSGTCWSQEFGFWQRFGDLPWVKAARERNEQRRPVCVYRLPEAQRLVQWNPRDSNAWETIGRCKLQAGALDEAVAAFRRIIGLESDRADRYSLLGHALLQKGEREGAREMFEAAIRRDPKEDQAYRGLGAYYAAVDNPGLAIENYERGLQLANPQGPGLFTPDDDYRTVAFLYPKLDNRRLTAKAFERAVQVFLIDDDLHFRYGMALVATGEFQKALEEVKWLENTGREKLAEQLATAVKTRQQQ